MNPYRDVLHAAFRDELEKIAGALTGFTRIGRRPISAAKLLNRGGKKVSDIVKTSAISGKSLALMGAGAYALHQAQKVKRRYETGKQLEYQQRQGY